MECVEKQVEASAYHTGIASVRGNAVWKENSLDSSPCFPRLSLEDRLRLDDLMVRVPWESVTKSSRSCSN